MRAVAKFVRSNPPADTTKSYQPTSSKFLKLSEKERYPNYSWECLVQKHLRTIRLIVIIKLTCLIKTVMINSSFMNSKKYKNINKLYLFLRWVKIVLWVSYLIQSHRLLRSQMIARRIRVSHI